jgi:hypothetical protein
MFVLLVIVPTLDPPLLTIVAGALLEKRLLLAQEYSSLVSRNLEKLCSEISQEQEQKYPGRLPANRTKTRSVSPSKRQRHGKLQQAKTKPKRVVKWTAHEATIPLKCYSPEFMVQSVYRAETFDALRQGGSWTVDTVPTLLEQSPAARHAVDAMVETVVSGIGRCHALVVGPGLGRCPLVGYAVGLILQRVHQKCPHMPVILDADALWFVSQSTLWQEMVMS